MLIRSLVTQLRGSIGWRSEGGTEAILRFPLEPRKQSISPTDTSGPPGLETEPRNGIQ